MEFDQKLTELKKAYADMILNTAKEAAARIMASERKTRRLEFELKHCKENSLQMLTRLKQMMDLKISEAEKASKVQQSKIEELEAQLHEAEDIVKDLREELSLSQKKQGKLMVQVYEALEKNTLYNNTPDEHSITLPPLEEEEANVFPPSKGKLLYNSFWNSYIDDQDLPAIISRSKGRKMYRTGCSQRIYSCERTPLAEQTNHVNDDLVTKVPKLSSTRKKRTRCEYQSLFLTSARSTRQENSNGSVDTKSGTCLVRVSDNQRKIIEELRPMDCEKTDLPLSVEAQVLLQPTNSKVIKYTFQRKRKRGMMNSEKNDESKNALLETEKVNSKEESTQNETEKEKVYSEEESTQEENGKVNSVEESTQRGMMNSEKKEENKNAFLETEKVNSKEESTQNETEKKKVYSEQESTQEEKEKAESVEELTQQLI